MVIWWQVLSEIFVPKIIKIWQLVFKLRSKMSGMFFETQWKPNGLSRVWCNVKTKLKTIAELKEKLQSISGNMPQGPIDKAVKKLFKLSDWRLVLKLGAGGGHVEHSQWQWNSGIWLLVNCVVSTMLLNWCCNLNIFDAEKLVSPSQSC